MNIVMPMAGEGKRFSDANYKRSKPSILTFDRRSGRLLPMAVCATHDLPAVSSQGENVIYIDRECHVIDGTEDYLKAELPKARFITLNSTTQGQACTCLMAKEYIDNDEELLIAGCDSGLVYSEEKFWEKTKTNDVLVFTFRHSDTILSNPNAYGWMITDANDQVIGVSIKRAISDTPKEDHAVAATFWFKHGRDFVAAAEKMIREDDRINGEFYVDEVVRHALEMGLKTSVFEVDRYLCWGTPIDFENYQNTYRYWERFLKDGRCFLNITGV